MPMLSMLNAMEDDLLELLDDNEIIELFTTLRDLMKKRITEIYQQQVDE